MTDTAQLEFRNVSFRYASSEKATLRDITFRAEQGELICLLGPSGCGKSTLLRLAAGLEHPDCGSITAQGHTVETPGLDRMLVFQENSLFPWLTTLGNVRFALRRSGHCSRREANAAAQKYLFAVGLGEFADYYPSRLSGGMRQRAAIARALSMNPGTILMDEPFGAQDIRNRADLQELLLTLHKSPEGEGKTILFVTHDIREAVRLADRILVMGRGSIFGEYVPLRPEDSQSAEQEVNTVAQMVSAAFEQEQVQ